MKRIPGIVIRNKDLTLPEEEKCRCCKYPLVLRKNDDPNNPLFDQNHYEDDNGGICHNCRSEGEGRDKRN